MKTVQVMFEESLLAELDDTADVREKGRSAVFRQLASDFVQRREQERWRQSAERCRSLQGVETDSR